MELPAADEILAPRRKLTMSIRRFPGPRILLSLAVSTFFASQAIAQVTLLAVGSVTGSTAGENADLSGLNYNLENGAPANLLGGLGSGLTYAAGNKFLALPDRGPNAISFNSAIDDTTSYINRFHTITMELTSKPDPSGLPFSVNAHLINTSLLWSATDLVYGTGSGLNVGSGVPPVNDATHHYFTGRSDNFDAAENSGNPANARFDTEGIRVSNDKKNVYISDEYGPYVYEFDKNTGQRLRSFTLPDDFYVPICKPVGADEISGNTIGRTANKGMEGLAITPDGTTLVGIVQAALLQDAAQKGSAKLLRIVEIDIASGDVTHQYAYLLTTGSGVSEILALNNHEFLVDERDGRGREGGDNLTSNDARVKQVFKIDLEGATDVTGMDGLTAAGNAVTKTLFLDIVHVLVVDNGFSATFDVPSKIEGLTFGPDVTMKGKKLHTLWVSNDNDFVLATGDTPPVPNPNQFFVFGFTDADLGGSQYVPQF
jgi:hypothetical protein